MGILQFDHVVKKFGGLTVVDCSFNIDERTVVGLIGPNGAGKTTIFNLIMGCLLPDSGAIYYKGKRINGLRPWDIASIGIGRTFQITRLFKNMTTLQNMLVASLNCREGQRFEKVLENLELVSLLGMKEEHAENLSYGQQKLLEFARVLTLNPDLLLLDEPIAGVNPVLAESMLSLIKELPKKDKTVILIEHNLRETGPICDKVIALDSGQVIAEGTFDQIQRNEKVVKSYFLA